jgi:hypothetical protein
MPILLGLWTGVHETLVVIHDLDESCKFGKSLCDVLLIMDSYNMYIFYLISCMHPGIEVWHCKSFPQLCNIAYSTMLLEHNICPEP